MTTTGLSLLIRLGGIGLSFAALLVLARALDSATLGRWAWLGEIIALLCVVCALGINLTAIRVVPDCLAARDGAGLRRFVRTALAAGACGGVVLGTGLVLASWAGALGGGITPGIAVLAVGVLLAFATLRCLQEVVRGAGHPLLAQLGEQIVWPLALLGAGLALWSAPGLALPVALLLAVQIAVFTALSAVLALVVWRLSIPLANDAHPLPNAGAAPPGEWRGWLAAGVPLAMAAAFSVFLRRGDMIMLGALGDPREVAAYLPASRIAGLLVLGQAAASMVSASRLRDNWRAGDRAAAQRQLDAMALLSVAFAAPLALACWLFPAALLGLFGAGYAVAAPVLVLLGLAQMVNCWTGAVACAVVVCDLERAFAGATMAAALALFAALAVLVPRFGMVGAAAASLGAIAILNGAMAWLVWQRSGLACWLRPACIPALMKARTA